MECWNVGKLERLNVGKLGRWNVGKLEVGKLGPKLFQSRKVRPNKVGKLESEAQDIGQKLESQHRRLNITTTTNTTAHDEYLNYSGILLLYILSLIGVLISNQEYT